MVTVANTDVKVRYLDDWPAGVTDVTVTALCTRAETLIQSKAGTAGTFPLTGAAGIELSVDLVVNWIKIAQWSHRDTDTPSPIAWTKEMQQRFDTILQEDSGIDLVDEIDFNVG